MGIFDDLLKKNKKNEELEGVDLAEEVYQRLIDNKSIDYIDLTLCEQKCDLFDNKISGPYFLEAGDNLVNDDGKPLFLLAQLNFDRLPHLDKFPTSGILQLFIDGYDGMYGMSFDDYHTIYRYYPKIPSNYQVIDYYDEQAELPFEEKCEYKLLPVIRTQCISSEDYRFNDTVNELCKDLCDDMMDCLYNDDEAFDYLTELLDTPECQIGGYPFFTQSDIRTNSDNKDILLFQLTSNYKICFGDCGVANFFISEEDLMRLDFSNVMYSWDCY